MYENIFTWIGLLTSSYVGLKLLYKIYHFCRVYGFPTYPDFSKYGKWSVVTGATNGIGKEIAFQLASKGQNIVLIARNKDLLEKVSKEIESKHGVQTTFLQIDFSNDESIYTEIEEFLKDLDIGVLINNVGIAHGLSEYLNIPNLSTTLGNITRINMFSMFKMHQIVLPGMVQRKRGLIVNLSSGSAIRPLPYFSVYGGTKAFVNYFSQALSYEYADKGITIQSCMPLFVQSNMTKHAKTYNGMIKTEDFVTSSLATVDKESLTNGCWQHALQAFGIKLLPAQMLNNELKKRLDKQRAYELKKNL